MAIKGFWNRTRFIINMFIISLLLSLMAVVIVVYILCNAHYIVHSLEIHLLGAVYYHFSGWFTVDHSILHKYYKNCAESKTQ